MCGTAVNIRSWVNIDGVWVCGKCHKVAEPAKPVKSFEESNVYLIFPVTCTCSGTTEHEIEHAECRCTGDSRFRDRRPSPISEDGLFPARLVDAKGFHHCRYCGKYCNFPGVLVQCPNCLRFHPGPRPYFPFDFECGECE